MKDKLSMISMFVALSVMGTENPYDYARKHICLEDSEEEKNLRLAKAEAERNKANGLKEFFYGKNSLWALNQKSADKKAKKLGYL